MGNLPLSDWATSLSDRVGNYRDGIPDALQEVQHRILWDVTLSVCVTQDKELRDDPCGDGRGREHMHSPVNERFFVAENPRDLDRTVNRQALCVRVRRAQERRPRRCKALGDLPD